MAFITGAVIGGVIGAAGAAYAANKSSNAAKNINAATLDSQRQIYEDQTARFEPFRQIGLAALPQYYEMMGLTPPPGMDIYANSTLPSEVTPAITDIAGNPGIQGGVDAARGAFGLRYMAPASTASTPQITAPGSTVQAAERNGVPVAPTSTAPALSPLARWELQQGQQALNDAEAARGINTGGGAATRAANLQMQVAGEDYVNQYNRILQALQIGTGASSSINSSASGYSSAVGQAGTNAGNIALNQGQANADFWSGLGSIPMDYYNMTQKLPTTGTTAAGAYTYDAGANTPTTGWNPSDLPSFF